MILVDLIYSKKSLFKQLVYEFLRMSFFIFLFVLPNSRSGSNFCCAGHVTRNFDIHQKENDNLRKL